MRHKLEGKDFAPADQNFKPDWEAYKTCRIRSQKPLGMAVKIIRLFDFRTWLGRWVWLIVARAVALLALVYNMIRYLKRFCRKKVQNHEKTE